MITGKCVLNRKKTVASPISHAVHIVASQSILFCFCEYFDATLCPPTSACHFKKKDVCVSFIPSDHRNGKSFLSTFKGISLEAD